MRIHGGSRASTATTLPTDAARVKSGSPVTAASPMIGAPRAPYDTGALLAMAATLMASSSAMPSPTRMGATTAQG